MSRKTSSQAFAIALPVIGAGAGVAGVTTGPAEVLRRLLP